MGEIHFANAFVHAVANGYRGIFSTEHGNAEEGAEGEWAVITAYRAVDPRPANTAAE